MSITIQPNPYLISDVTVAANSKNGDDLIVMTVSETSGPHTETTRVVLDRRFWQKAVDDLATLGITESAADPTETRTEYGVRWDDDPEVERVQARFEAERLVALHAAWDGVVVSRTVANGPWEEVSNA